MKNDSEENERSIDEVRRVVREEIGRALCSADVREVPDEAPPGRVLSGELRYFRLPEVLHLVSLQGLTGRLSMSSGGSHVDIYFRGGDVAFATGDTRASREQLGHLLVRMGRLTQGALDQALEKCRATGERLGRVLSGDGTVSTGDIRAALMKQTERSVYKAMAWDEGRFEFELSAMPEFVEDIPLGIKAEDLVLERVGRLQELRLVAGKIPRLDIVFTKPAHKPEDTARLELGPEEKMVLELVDGDRDVNELIRVSGLSEFSLLKALYALYSVGIIRKSGPAGKDGRTQYL